MLLSFFLFPQRSFSFVIALLLVKIGLICRRYPRCLGGRADRDRIERYPNHNTAVMFPIVLSVASLLEAWPWLINQTIVLPRPKKNAAGNRTQQSSLVIGAYRLISASVKAESARLAGRADRSCPPSVAIKVIEAGMDTARVVARFEAERQALAVMDHPAIAEVFDAGRYTPKTSVLVMEYAKGEAITKCSDRNRLSTRDRLDLFLDVCEACTTRTERHHPS